MEAQAAPALARRAAPSRSAAPMRSRAPSSRDAGDDLGERRVDGLEEGGPHEELLGLLVEIPDDLLREVVVQLAVGPAQAVDECPVLARRAVAQGGVDQLGEAAPASVRSARAASTSGLEVGRMSRGTAAALSNT